MCVCDYLLRLTPLVDGFSKPVLHFCQNFVAVALSSLAASRRQFFVFLASLVARLLSFSSLDSGWAPGEIAVLEINGEFECERNA